MKLIYWEGCINQQDATRRDSDFSSKGAHSRIVEIRSSRTKKHGQPKAKTLTEI